MGMEHFIAVSRFIANSLLQLEAYSLIKKLRAHLLENRDIRKQCVLRCQGEGPQARAESCERYSTARALSE